MNTLFDRFLVRIKSDYVDTDLLEEVLLAGWKLENETTKEMPHIASEEIRILQQEVKKVDLSTIRKNYVNLVYSMRNAGLKVSDRRAVKFQNLIASSAMISDRSKAILSDLWVLKYVWDTEEQIEILSGIIDKVIEKENAPKAHPQAFAQATPNSEVLQKELETLAQKRDSEGLSFEEQNIIKDKLRYIQTRVKWLQNQEHKQHLEKQIEELWKKMLQTISG